MKTKMIQQLDKLGRNIENNEVTENKVSENNGNINDKGVSLNAKQVTVDKVSNTNNEVVENETSMHDLLSKNSGDDESRKLVEVRGALMSVIELEREYEDSLNVECEQRAKFARDVECEAETSQLFLEDESSSIVLVEDKRSSKCPVVFSVPGKTRWCYNNVILPSERSENVKLVWKRDYKEGESVIELFNLKRGYKELVESLTKEGGDKINLPSKETQVTDDIDDSPCVVVNDDYIDIEGDKHLPVVRISVLVIDDGYNDENINYLIVTNDTEGALTIPDVDTAYDKIIMGDDPGNYYYVIVEKTSFYGYYINNSNILNLNKNELCMFNIRLIFDDGGQINSE